MADWKDEVENIVYPGRIKVPYKWSVGETGSRFLVALRDDKEIWGTKCPSCNKVYVPPLKNCGECFTLTDEWVKVGSTGTLASFTVVHYAHAMQPVETPFAYGLIRLDGARKRRLRDRVRRLELAFVHGLIGEDELQARVQSVVAWTGIADAARLRASLFATHDDVAAVLR